MLKEILFMMFTYLIKKYKCGEEIKININLL